MTSESSFSAFSRRVLAFIERCPEGVLETDHDFNRLALELFELQFMSIPVYREFCQSQGVEPGRATDWRAIPVLPTRAFKEWALTSLPEEERRRVFVSSGTTGNTSRSRHYHGAASLRIYEASLVRWFGRHLLADHSPTAPSAPGRGLQFLALTPPGTEAPESSLVHMLETVRSAFAFTGGRFVGSVGPDGKWRLDFPGALEALKSCTSQRTPVVLLGTAFLFVHLLDHLAENGEDLRLPPGSRLMETGGYKGFSRVLERGRLHDLLCARLGIARSCIVSEYGMSELSSQAYDRIAGMASARAEKGGVFGFPPWARVQVISPETGREAADGETGLVRIYDLANVYSLMAVQTEDLAVRRGPDIDLAGRAPQAELRGCSLMAHEPGVLA